MSGFTGINPSKASQDFEALNEFCGSLNGAMKEAFIHAASMAQCWASPNAIEFGNTYIPQMNDISRDFCVNAMNIIERTRSVINILLTVNGYGGVSSGYTDLSLVEYDNNFQESEDEITGMNMEVAKLLLEGYNKGVALLYEILSTKDEISLAVYDPNGQLQGEFKNMVTSFETKIREIVEGMSNSLTTALETEIDQVGLAVQTAASALEGDMVGGDSANIPMP